MHVFDASYFRRLKPKIRSRKGNRPEAKGSRCPLPHTWEGVVAGHSIDVTLMSVALDHPRWPTRFGQAIWSFFVAAAAKSIRAFALPGNDGRASRSKKN